MDHLKPNTVTVLLHTDAVDERVTAFVNTVCEKFGGQLDSVVNNAAIGQDQLLMHTDPETIQQIVNINIVGPTFDRVAIKRMLLQGSGNICNISSICGSRGYAGLSVMRAKGIWMR